MGVYPGVVKSNDRFIEILYTLMSHFWTLDILYDLF